MIKYINRSFIRLDEQVNNNLEVAGVITRPVKSNGLWCHILLPTILILYNILFDVPQLYQLTTYMSVGLLIYSTLFIIFTSVSSVFIRDNVFGGVTVAGLISALLIYINLNYGIMTALIMSLPTILIYSFTLRNALKQLPNTFTFGEAIVVVQGLILFVFMGTMYFFTSSKLGLIGTTSLVFIFSVILMVLVLSNLNNMHKDIQTLYYIIAGGALFCLIVLHIAFGRTYLYEFFLYLFFDVVRIKVFLFWLCLLIISSIVVWFNTKKGQKADTTTRKFFHIVGSLVFMIGILCDREYMTVCSALAFGLLIFLEALRKSDIEPFSSSLQSAFLIYCDEKDVGSFSMTPIYLFVGLSCPLLLVPVEFWDDQIDLLSGVLSIGIGDTTASYMGKYYGTVKWPGSQRTMEGTVFNIISQLGVSYLLFASDLIVMSTRSLLKATFAAFVTGFVEAKLEQVDNLVLPLIHILWCLVINCMF